MCFQTRNIIHQKQILPQQKYLPIRNITYKCSNALSYNRVHHPYSGEINCHMIHKLVVAPYHHNFNYCKFIDQMYVPVHPVMNLPILIYVPYYLVIYSQ